MATKMTDGKIHLFTKDGEQSLLIEEHVKGGFVIGFVDVNGEWIKQGEVADLDAATKSVLGMGFKLETKNAYFGD